jgi:type II secretory pathway pseudopilin PulG
MLNFSLEPSFPRQRTRAGLTLVEVAASLLILALAAVVVVPSLNGYRAHTRARETSDLFVSLGYSLNNNNTPFGGTGFINTVLDAKKSPPGVYPSRLRDLVIPITTATATHRDCSQAAYTANRVTSWNVNAPFTGLLVEAGVGVTSPLGVIRDSVYKGVGNTANMIELRIDSVSTGDVENVDFYMDGAYDSTTGRIRYVAGAGGDLHLLKFVIPAYVGC